MARSDLAVDGDRKADRAHGGRSSVTSYGTLHGANFVWLLENVGGPSGAHAAAATVPEAIFCT